MNMRLFISCAIGAERALGNELRHLGLAILDSGKGKFDVQADSKGALLALRSLRCAERVFVVLDSFRAHQFEDLFQGIRGIDWSAWLPADAKIHIDKVRIHESSLNSFASVQSVAQKAAYEKLCQQYNQRSMPESGTTHLVRLYIDHNMVRVCLDLAGDALHKRGYRVRAGEAPLKESIASALIIMSGWRRRHPFHDPFCGSGTLPAEALMFAADIAPNLNRPLAFAKMNNYDPKLDAEIIAGLKDRITDQHEFVIRASDRDPRMVELTKETLSALLLSLGIDQERTDRLASRIVVEHCRMENLKHRENDGWFFCNPPWGERLGDQEEALATYRAMRHLNDTFPDWAVSAVTTYPDLNAEMARRFEWRKPVHNGSADSWFYLFNPLSKAAR